MDHGIGAGRGYRKQLLTAVCSGGEAEGRHRYRRNRRIKWIVIGARAERAACGIECGVAAATFAGPRHFGE